MEREGNVDSLDNPNNIIVEVRTVRGKTLLRLSLGVLVAQYMDSQHLASYDHWDIYANGTIQKLPEPAPR
jgi:hypothetical protein